ncbi:MAG: methyl-accepting chemotaxis protein [Chloroflexota bacterium]
MGVFTRVTFFNTIQNKLLAAFLGLTLIPIILLSVIAFSQSTSAFVEKTNTQNLQVAYYVSQATSTWLSERKDDMVTLAGTARVRTMDPSQASEAVQQYYQQWKVYETLFVANLNGDTIAINDNTPRNISDRAYFQQAVKGEIVASDPLVSKATGNVIIVFAAPVYKDNKVVGIVGGTVPTDYVKQLLSNGWKGETGDAYLVNKEGFFISPPRYADQLKQQGLIKERAELEYQVDTYAVQQAAAGNHGTSEYVDYQGKTVLGAYYPIEGTSWSVIIEQDHSEALAALNHLRNMSILITFVTAIIVVLLAFLLARSLGKPIQQISHTADQLALGDIDQNIVLQRGDEIGKLADSFRTLINYQQQVAEIAQRLAQKDLAVSISPKSEKDMLGHSLVQMLANLKETISTIAGQAVQLLSASDQLALAADQSGRATNQITATIQQVARGASQQAESINQTASSVEQMTRAINGVARGAQEQAQAVGKASSVVHMLTAAIQQVAGNSQKVSQESSTASEAAQQGKSTVQQTIEGMQRIKAQVGFSAEKVQNMGERSNQIGAIVETIEDIASQTNLLALNAAIEAARAGEHGKGFAVVADEVRKLAERAAQATKEISSLIQDIQQTVAEAVTAMQESTKEVEQEADRAGNAGQALDAIQKSIQAVVEQAEQAAAAAKNMENAAGELVEAMDSVSAVVEENTAATEQMAASATQVSQAIENIASVSEENSAAIEEVSASSEEMTAQVEEVNAAAQSLAEMARSLQQIVAEFKLENAASPSENGRSREKVLITAG